MIKLQGVTKKYKTGVNALNGMDLSIAPGEFVYVIGPTGSGKSSFMKLLYREEKATTGKVYVDGMLYGTEKLGVNADNYDFDGLFLKKGDIRIVITNSSEQNDV